MPRPGKLEALFGQERPNNNCDWKSVAEHARFYVQGLNRVLASAGVQVKADNLYEASQQAVKAANSSSWTGELQSNQWNDFANNQADRACRFVLMTLPKAALAILAADHLVRQRQPSRDIYEEIVIVPSLSYISDLTFEVFDSALAALHAQHRNDVGIYLKQQTGQLDFAVFREMAAGKTVTKNLAASLLAIVQAAVPGFSGTVDDDQLARMKFIARVRGQAHKEKTWKRKAKSNPGKYMFGAYVAKISSSRAETFNR